MPTLGPWELVRLLGRGGMGEVWLARDPKDGRDVALKVLAPGALLRDAESHSRFAREARVLQELEHPGIVRCLGADLSAQRPWIALEHVPGRTLEELVKTGGPLEGRRVAELGAALAEALEAAHARGIVHRDVKPGNAILDPEGRTRLIDFGLARVYIPARDVPLTFTGQVLGSPAFLPPEQAEGDRARVGPASDVYGLGATLYYLLTGQAPHDRGEWLATINAVLLAPLEPPSQRVSVDPALEAIVVRCLEREPSRRFPTAGAVGLALRAWLERPAPLRRRRAWPLVALSSGLSLLAAAGLWLHRREPPVPPPPPTATPAAPASVAPSGEPATALEHLRRGVEREAKDDLLGALADYERACELDPNLARAHYGRAAILTRREDDRGALEAFRRCAELEPDDAATHLALGKVRRRLGDAPGALASLDRSIELLPDRPDAYEIRGGIRFMQGDVEGALRDWDRQVSLAPDSPNAWFNRGMARQNLDDFEGALSDLARFLELAPDHQRSREVREVMAQMRAALGR